MQSIFHFLASQEVDNPSHFVGRYTGVFGGGAYWHFIS
jgi:hypothetical protein